MVVCPHALASEVGVALLRQGGSAVDAAIAVNAALAVVYPHMTGIGGDSFWLIYSAAENKIYGLNGSGRSGQAATREFYTAQNLSAIPQRGPLAAVTVPGIVDAWNEAHQRWGQLPWSQLLEPAIALAEQGYPVTASQARWTQRDQEILVAYPGSRSAFLPGGQPPQPGDRLSNPALAQTLKTLAAQGRDAFYQGEIAEALVGGLRSLGGVLQLEDFAHHRSTWTDPISTSYRGYRVYEMPPNTQGLAVLQMLNLIEPFDLLQMGLNSADYYHLLVEVTKLAFAERDRWLSDPDFVKIPVERLISKAYSDRHRHQISLTQANAYLPNALGGDTTYTAVVDPFGNAVSLIQSLYFDFGSGVVPGNTGVILQNRGSFFSLQNSHVNCLEPGKRTFHTLIPAMVTHADGRPAIVLGTMGGEGQPQTQIALLTRMIDFGLDPQTAIDLPRWLWGRTWGEASSQLCLEQPVEAEVQAQLKQRQHPLKIVPAWSEQMGHAHAIAIDTQTGQFTAGCDPRSDGAALGY
ncbi:MAG: gamma-glutamyltransferase [Leptolyngbyaceae cyanobacterium SL_1_1]|nr:gamma-glutamyltransferase [Leptolyngbyaceae cyanobacterium RM1_1_2]NJO11764.1 gamma-glutamyltransferase [Leptolyngbyaceae cyanobacterium SL_1_1]